MARPDKAAAVAELTEGFRSSTAVVLTEYRGLSVAQLKELRRSLGEDVTYAVVKNTLTKIAARQAAVTGLDDLLAGPSAIAFVSGDPVVAAKGLRDFAKAHPMLVIKGGVMDGRSLTPDEIRKLADLESREVLLAMLAGAMKASLSGAVSLFAAPLAQAARLIEALRLKAEQDPSVLRGGTGTPVTAEQPDEVLVEPDEQAAVQDEQAAVQDEQAAVQDEQAAVQDEQAAVQDEQAAVQDEQAAVLAEVPEVYDEQASGSDEQPAEKDDDVEAALATETDKSEPVKSEPEENAEG
jgi:large subunit ribosomal protein L10